ncbi:MAG: 30S ribosomal protein S20 [Cyanobacteria bacterium M5B4]|nr:MAG: 30S ribosomal protein S20 [Cyanobacteria bacterium M5B4]
MANIKSAAKKAQIAERNRLRNKSYKSAIATLMKNYLRALETHKEAPTAETKAELDRRLSLAFSKIDRAVKAGVIHRNTGNRRKARLSKSTKNALGTV